MKEIVIYSDGSSLGNCQVSSRAAAVAILGYRGHWRAVGEYMGQATNQQAEIVAAAIGLEALKEPCRVKLYSDSRYVIETMCGRFRKKTNHDWWARIDKAKAKHEIDWQWLKGHAGHEIQEACDLAARTIAARGRVDDDVLTDAVQFVEIHPKP